MQKSQLWPRKFAHSATTWRSRQYLLLTITESKTPRPSCTPLRSRFLAARMRTFSPPRQPGKILPKRENAPGPRAHCANAASPKRAHMTNVGHRPKRVRPREHKRLDSQVRHFGHDLLQKDCEHIVPRGNTAIFSPKYDIRLALRHIGRRRLAEACPYDNLWCTGPSACNLRISSPDTWF